MQREPFDCCAYIKQVTDHPLEKAPPIKVWQFLQIKEHLTTCETCLKLTDDILTKYPPEKEEPFSVN